ncbi:alpha/beta-hydrolase [Mycena vitilis]|nr:alpha/beta-hydrolase [Mycena vitilis]
MLFRLALLSHLHVALSVPVSRDEASGTPTPVSLAAMNQTFLRPAQFAALAYCSTASIMTLSCGTPCDAFSTSNIEFLQTGGDGGEIPLYYIAHDAEDESLVVAHEGTDVGSFLSVLNDAKFELVALNATRFPETAGKNITVHDGFQETFERTADELLAGVQAALASTGVKKITVTGHSLGAALASMTGIMIKNAVDPTVDVSVSGFGLPRGGNKAWANFVDSKIGLIFVTNQHDPVPTLPPMFLGFQHTSGEVHIVDDTQKNFVACPGQENENCVVGNSVLSDDIFNHLGPYFDAISFGGHQCSS